MKKNKALLILILAVILFGGGAISFIGLTHEPAQKTNEIPIDATAFFPAQ